MEHKILFRTIIEVLGRPKEHVEQSLTDYVENIKKDERFKIHKQEIAEVEKREKEELWSIFAELDISVKDLSDLVFFCFQYMPSSIEIIEPEELQFSSLEITHLFNDLQAKLHNIDMIAKQMKIENDTLKKNTGILLKNYIVVLLSKGQMSSEDLSKFTGVAKEKLEDFLDQLIDSGQVDLKDGVYFLIKKEKNGNGQSN